MVQHEVIGDDMQAIELGQHAIDNSDIIGTRQSQRQADITVAGVIDHMPRFFQAVDQIALRLQIVLYDKNAHGFLPGWLAPSFRAS